MLRTYRHGSPLSAVREHGVACIAKKSDTSVRVDPSEHKERSLAPEAHQEAKKISTNESSGALSINFHFIVEGTKESNLRTL